MKELIRTILRDNADNTSFAAELGLTVRSFGKREVIADIDERIGIILDGSAYIAGVNEAGKRGIIDFFVSGDIFGSFSIPPLAHNSYFYLACAESCSAAFTDYAALQKKCAEGNPAAQKIMKHICFDSVSEINAHIYILEQRTLAEKLTMFFELMSRKTNSDTFTVPMSYTNLADYLAADRSAMMRELRRLNELGAVSSDRLKITLLRHNVEKAL